MTDQAGTTQRHSCRHGIRNGRQCYRCETTWRDDAPPAALVEHLERDHGPAFTRGFLLTAASINPSALVGLHAASHMIDNGTRYVPDDASDEHIRGEA